MKNKKLFTLIIFICFVFSSCTIKTTEQYYNESNSENTDLIAVTFSIDCKKIVENKLNSLQNDGIIIDKTEYHIPKNSSVYDLLIKAVKKNKIPIEIQGNELNKENSVYIEGIDNIYEFDYGELSGWIYLVNNQQILKSADKCILNDGDIVEWKYTLDLNKTP